MHRNSETGARSKSHPSLAEMYRWWTRRALEARQPVQAVMEEAMEYIKQMQALGQLEQRANKFLMDTQVCASLEAKSKTIQLTSYLDRQKCVAQALLTNADKKTSQPPS